MTTHPDRPAAFKTALAALNAQFAAWVASSASTSPHALWTDAARDYVRHAAGLVEEYKDVLAGEEWRARRERAEAPMRAALAFLILFSPSIHKQARPPSRRQSRRQRQVCF